MHTCSPAIVYAHMEYTCTHAHTWRIVTHRVHLHTSQKPFHSLTQRTNTCILFCDTDCLEGYSGPFRSTQPGLISWNLILAGFLDSYPVISSWLWNRMLDLESYLGAEILSWIWNLLLAVESDPGSEVLFWIWHHILALECSGLLS